MRKTAKDLSIEEKIRLLTGKTAWITDDLGGKIPSLFMADGANGLRKYIDEEERFVKATAFPTMSSMANSWNVENLRKMCAAIADECVENNVDMLLGPGVNVKRTPLSGRNFEYVSEDPYLTGVYAREYVKTVQEKGVSTCIKHFAANNSENYRYIQSSEVDERTLREIYTKAFEMAMSSAPWAVMSSYNPVNGVLACENRKLLKGVLRDDLGFDGVVYSDWSAVKNRAKSLKATIDLEMPYNSASFGVMKAAYESGYITEKEMDESVDRLLALLYKLEEKKKIRRSHTDKQSRHALAVECAKESAVLLKNEGVLPMPKGVSSLCVLRNESDFMGGGGAAHVETDYPYRHLDETLAAKLPNAKVTRRSYICADDEGEYCFVCVGNDCKTEMENVDRTTIRLSPKQELLIRTAAKIYPNTVVVLYTGSAVDVSPWIDEVKGVVQAGFAGEGVNEGLAPLLIGEESPSGKLSETYPVCIEDSYCGAMTDSPFYERYDDGVFVGYRYYDSYDIPVQFEFGFGLSYAKFVYSNLTVKKLSETDYEVAFDITNTSDIDGKEVAQIYVRDVMSSVSRPKKELVAFEKVLVKAGQTERVVKKLDKSAFAFFSPVLNDWYVENGKFEIMVGASVKDIRLSDTVKIALADETQYSAFDQVFTIV